MNEFEYLLQLYKKNKATPEELKRFADLLATGDYDDLVRENLESAVNESAPSPIFHNPHLKTELHARLMDKINSQQQRHRPFYVIPFARIAAAAAVLIVAIGCYWIYQRSAIIASQLSTIASSDLITLNGPDYIELPDGSHVTLKEGSILSYDQQFGISDRQVSLQGEALFDVVHNAQKPFAVRTGKMVTKVLGTSFVVRYGRPNDMTVTVKRGKVSVGDSLKVFEILTPNQQLAITKDGIKKTSVDSELATAWTKNYFILDNVTFKEAMQEIEKRFNVRVRVKNSELNNCPVQAYFLNQETLKQVVEAVSSIQQAQVSIKDDVVEVSGGYGCSHE